MSAEPRRVVHLLPATDDAGAENQARYLLDELSSRSEYAVELVYFRRGRAQAAYESLDVPMHHVEQRRRLALDWRRRARALHDLYAEKPPAILHTWLYEANVVGAHAIRGWRDTRLVMTQRSGNALRSDRRRLRVLHRLRGRPDHVLANSQEGMTLLLELGYETARVSLVPNAIPPERVTVTRSRAAVRGELGLAIETRVVCAVGRADQTKDLPNLMAALERVRAASPDVRLLLIGPTPDDLATLGVSLPADALALGWQADPASTMAACDIVALSSWTEGHSNVADEALMLGLPVVCTDTGDHAAIVAACGGRVVPIRDPEALAAGVLELLSAPPNRQRVATLATQALSPRAAADATLAVYAAVLARD